MTHASVFSGIGGPEVAATMLGWENLFHCEINEFGRKVLDYWYPNSKSYEDITKTDFRPWRGQVDVLTGGFPCQPFSYAGRRKGAEDDRYLWPSMYRAIDEIQPTWVVAENVAGILTMVEQGEVSKVEGTANLFDAFDNLRGRYEMRETFTLQRICTDLESHGYAVQPVLVPACAVGAPHRRDRVFIVARRVASDSDNGADRRTAREDEGKGREERIQEQHEVRKPDEPNQVRPTSEGDAPTDSACGGEGTSRPSGGIEGNGATRINSRANGEQRPNGLIDFMNFYDLIPETSEQKMMEGQFLLTPSASDGLRGQMTMDSLKRHNKVNAENSNLAEQIAHKVGGGNSRLSPLFTEEMMGFPLMWTALPFLSESGAPKPSKPTATPSSPK